MRPNVREIRKGLKMSQPEFADRFGIELETLRQWEQGKRRPNGAARTLLIVISRIPQAVEDALKAA